MKFFIITLFILLGFTLRSEATSASLLCTSLTTQGEVNIKYVEISERNLNPDSKNILCYLYFTDGGCWLVKIIKHSEFCVCKDNEEYQKKEKFKPHCFLLFNGHYFDIYVLKCMWGN